jgi:hypothetical protein
MAVNLNALLANVDAICKLRQGAEAVLSNDLFLNMLTRIFYRDVTVSPQLTEDPYLLNRIIEIASSIAKHCNSTNEINGSSLIISNIGRRVMYPLLRALVSMLTGEGLARNLLGYVVLIQDAPKHRRDVDVNGIYLFQHMDKSNPPRPVFRRIESGAADSNKLYIYYINQRWQISFALNSPYYIAYCRDDAVTPELAFEYWVYDGEEQSIVKTGGKDLSLLAPNEVGINVTPMADASIKGIASKYRI